MKKSTMVALNKPTASARRRGALVRELSPRGGTTRPEVVLEVRTALDFLVSLVGDTEPELLPVDAAWYTAARDSLSAPLRRDMERAFGHQEAAKGIAGWALIPLVIAEREVRTVADVVALAGKVTARELIGSACDDEEMSETRALADRYFAGEPGLHDELVASTPEALRAALDRLLREPETELRALRRVLRAWEERFSAVEPRVAQMQARDVAARRADLERLPLEDFIERATNGYRWTPDAGVRRVHLVPSYFARPYNYVFAGEGWHLFAYPLAETALDGDPAAVPQATIRLFKALGDASRMRILRYLTDGDLYLTEIAARMGLSKPTVKHHLAQLRAAGLVTVTETGGLTYYSLRRDRVAEAGPDLARYLGTPTR
jgi:DNA-binding transcriptional ArsR family regulator